LVDLASLAHGSLSLSRVAEVDALLAQGKAVEPGPPADTAADIESLKKGFFDYLGDSHDERIEAYIEGKKALTMWPFPQKLRDWNVADVGAWVRGLGMVAHVPAFEAAGVDGDQLMRMDAKAFRHALGVENMDQLSIFLHARESLRVADVRGDSRIGLLKANMMVTTAANSSRKGAAASQFSAVMREDNIVPDASVLFLQVVHGQTKRVETALRTGFDVGMRDETDNTVLHIAVKHGHYIIAGKILDMGADVNAKNFFGGFSFSTTPFPDTVPYFFNTHTHHTYQIPLASNPRFR